MKESEESSTHGWQDRTVARKRRSSLSAWLVGAGSAHSSRNESPETSQPNRTESRDSRAFPGDGDGGNGTGGESLGGSGGDGDSLTVTIEGPTLTDEQSVALTFTCSDAEGCTFECSVDDGAASPCTSPYDLDVPDPGSYTVKVVASTGDGETAEASHTVLVDRTAPVLVDVAFTAYDEITLTFDEAIDDDALQSSDFVITQVPSTMKILGVRAVGDTVLVQLSRLHLPYEGYALDFKVTDLLGHEFSETGYDLSSKLHSRLAFVSAAEMTGPMALPEGVTCDDASTGLKRADCICTHEASQAGMVGTFRALLSDSSDDASCRMRGLVGKVADKCGLAEEESLPPLGPWVRADGMPISGDYVETDTGRPFFATPGMTLTGDLSSTQVWTGSTDSLLAGNHCSDWALGTGTGYHSYPVESRIPFRFGLLGSTCSNPFGLLCMQVDSDGLDTKPIGDIPEEGRRMFISSTQTNGEISHASGAKGLAAADAICTELANDAELPGAEYVALLSDSKDDAYCRLLGLSGKKGGDQCGATAEQLAKGPFVSVHGHLLAEDVAELFSTGVREPYSADETGAFQVKPAVWTATNPDGTVTAPYACSDWMDSTTSGSYLGHPYLGGTEWFNSGDNVCSVSAVLICVQK